MHDAGADATRGDACAGPSARDGRWLRGWGADGFGRMRTAAEEDSELRAEEPCRRNRVRRAERS